MSTKTNRYRNRNCILDLLKWSVVVIIFPLFITLIASTFSYADNAEVLPKGVFSANLDSKYYFTIKERFDPDHDTEDLAVDYNTTLDSFIFPGLSLVELGFGMPPGSANVGRSIVSFEYDITKLSMLFAYGLTDRLTVGVYIPYLWQRNKVEARVNTSDATVGKNEALNTIAPFEVPGTVPLAKGDVQDLLGGGLDINGDGVIEVPGYGYKEFGTWSDNGIGDIEAGLKYQYLKTENWRLAFSSGVRFPTGEINDPDDLVDLNFGIDAYTLLFRSQNDYIGIEDLVLNTTFIYEAVLSDEQKLRVPDDVNQPITRNKEKVDRDIGDLFQLELSGEYTFMKGFSASLLYNYQYGFKDDVDGDEGFIYESLEDETDLTVHEYIVGLSYSTLPLFLEKEFPLPLVASLSYRNRFAGENITKSQYIGLGLQVFF